MNDVNFFRINMPYGLRRNNGDEWVVFNREYLPLGFNNGLKTSIHEISEYNELPVFSKYSKLSDDFIVSLVSKENITYDDMGEIKTVYLYKDATNPLASRENWTSYMSKLWELGTIDIAVSK